MEEHYNGEITKVNPPFKHPLFKTEYKLPNLKWKYCHKNYDKRIDDGQKILEKIRLLEEDHERVGDVMFTNSSEFYNFKTLIMRSNVTREDIEKTLNLRGFKKIYFPKTLSEIPNRDIYLFPYNYYTIDNVLSNVGTISEAGKNETPKWNEDQYKTFNNNIDKINNCRIDNNHFNMEIYCKFYCEQDVRILSLGHTEFRRLTLQEPIELDIDNYISAPSLSNAFFTKNVYSLIPELKQYSGVYREFIQKGVYGGRCMTNSNKKYHVTDELSDFDACSLYPSAMGRLYLPTGAPQVITAEMMDKDYLVNHVLPERELMPSINKPITAFFVEIEITHVGKHLNFPLICKRTKQGNSNVNECCTMFVDNYVLEDLIKYQQIEYKVIRGYYWTGPKSPLLSKVIREIYDLRVQYKREGNPLQEVLKLIMNSAYGKTIQKAIENDFEYKSNYKNRNGNSKAEKYLSKNFHKIEEIFDIGNNITAFKTKKGIDKHYVPNFIGVQVLSMSKRIMNEVMCTAEDLKIPIYYQDTDSMHIKVDSLNLLSEEFKKRYNRELIGSNMGQFHSDFDHKDGGKNIVSIESYFLGKKAYCDKLINENKQIDYHLRMKGIPNECLKMYSKDFNDEPLELYKYLFEDNYINFNILDVKPSFEMKNDMTIRSRQKFSRKIKF
ncbi:DNA-directed DNA polymerase [Entamoeba marina]